MKNEYCIYLRKSRGDSALEAMGVDVLERHERTLLDLAKQMNLSITAIYREVVSGDSISAVLKCKNSYQKWSPANGKAYWLWK